MLPAQGKITVENRDHNKSGEDDNMTLNLRLSDQAAAVIIQKEVR